MHRRSNKKMRRSHKRSRQTRRRSHRTRKFGGLAKRLSGLFRKKPTNPYFNDLTRSAYSAGDKIKNIITKEGRDSSLGTIASYKAQKAHNRVKGRLGYETEKDRNILQSLKKQLYVGQNLGPSTMHWINNSGNINKGLKEHNNNRSSSGSMSVYSGAFGRRKVRKVRKSRKSRKASKRTRRHRK